MLYTSVSAKYAHLQTQSLEEGGEEEEGGEGYGKLTEICFYG